MTTTTIILVSIGSKRGMRWGGGRKEDASLSAVWRLLEACK
jgi:hypothetical protein